MCAKKLQESIYDDKDLNVRVGVHLGDTIFEKGDVRGDGVNIASRLESMAVEGGVFISKEVQDQLVNQKDFDLTKSVIEKNHNSLKYKSLSLDKNVAKISVIGMGMMSQAGVAEKMFKTLAKNEINILAI